MRHVEFAWRIPAHSPLPRSIPGIFRDVHGFNIGQIGTVFVTIFIGAVIGWTINLYQEKLYQYVLVERCKLVAFSNFCTQEELSRPRRRCASILRLRSGDPPTDIYVYLRLGLVPLSHLGSAGDRHRGTSRKNCTVGHLY